MSCTTVQQMPLNEFSRDEIQKRIAEYESGLEKRLEAVSAQLSTHPAPENMPQSHVLSLENEDTEFIEEFMRVRNNDDVPLADDDVEAAPDPCLHMEFTLPRGVD